MTVEWFVFTRRDGYALNGEHVYSLPRGGLPGQWSADVPDGKLATSGYYGLAATTLAEEVGPELWRAELAGNSDSSGSRWRFARARLTARLADWTRRAMIAYACDCAERLLPPYVQLYPKDNRPAAALAGVRGLLAETMRPSELRRLATDAGDAAELAARSAYNERRGKHPETETTPFVDAARVANIIKDIADGAANFKDDPRLFFVRPATPADLAWQSARLMEYAKGKRRP